MSSDMAAAAALEASFGRFVGAGERCYVWMNAGMNAGMNAVVSLLPACQAAIGCSGCRDDLWFGVG